jgi:hypothetical protein
MNRQKETRSDASCPLTLFPVVLCSLLEFTHLNTNPKADSTQKRDASQRVGQIPTVCSACHMSGHADARQDHAERRNKSLMNIILPQLV